ncbi:tetratricopeptide repeat protein [Thermodesulfobacteriota bacterium]
MHRTPPTIVRYLILSILLLSASAAFYLLSQNLIGQLHIKKAEQEALALRFGSAAEQFHKAGKYFPDDYSIHNSLGNIYYKMGSMASEPSESLTLFKRAQQNFSKALQLNTFDARSAYGLARAGIQLEQLYALHDKKEIKTAGITALAALEKAIELRPASTIYHLAMTRYLHLHGEKKRVFYEVRILGQLQPAMLGQLRREPFWSVAVRRSFQHGVQEALAAGTTPRQSLFTLSEIMAEEQNYREAIFYRIKGMAVQEALNGSGDYIRLGYLHLMEDQRSRASENFFLALQHSADIEKDIIAIMRTCRNVGDPQSLVEFYRGSAKKYGISTTTGLYAANMLIGLQDFENAKTILHETNARQPTGEAYFQLMRIAEKEQDWDAAELAIQKAVMHHPANSNYHLVFSKVLNRLQKYERAEKEAGLAMQYIDNASAGLYHYRASLRMHLKQYEEAMQDWQKALELDPENQNYLNQLEKVKKLIGEE